MFIGLLAMMAVLSSCESTLHEDNTWGVTLHTSMIVDTYLDNDNILDTVLWPYDGAAVVYRKIDKSMIDTVIPQQASWKAVIHLNNGDTVFPIAISEYIDGIASIDGLTLNEHSTLLWSYTKQGGIVCDWIDISVAQSGMDIYDTVTRFGRYY